MGRSSNLEAFLREDRNFGPSTTSEKLPVFRRFFRNRKFGIESPKNTGSSEVSESEVGIPHIPGADVADTTCDVHSAHRVLSTEALPAGNPARDG